ncbi:MAG: putative zinc-binding peptidase [Pseudoxanthomonas sp.]
MKLFTCDVCGQVIYFENSQCLRCKARLAFDPEQARMVAVSAAGDGWVGLKDPAKRWALCANAHHDACNWLIDSQDASRFCRACRHNRTIPDLSCDDRLQAWRRIEVAKRRLYYTILRLRLPTPSPGSGRGEPLVFDFLANMPNEPRVMTGHDNGLITISLDEADDAKRESMRIRLGELYRTLLGHFRHEVGHYYWDRLVRDAGQGELARYRLLFGDERRDYGQALRAYYRNGAPADWQDRHVSPYATMHPWEDWAETWAHYFHMVDTLEMAGAFGVRVAPEVAGSEFMETEIDFDPHKAKDIQRIIDAWLPLIYAVNSLNRAMGQSDLYPFVVNEPLKAKLAYIHALVRANAEPGAMV